SRSVETQTRSLHALPSNNHASVAENYGHVGLSFEVNQGQTDARVNFITRTSDSTIFITPTEAVMVLSASGDKSGAPQASAIRSEENAARKLWALRMKVEGSNPAPVVRGLDELPGKVNYLIGNDPAEWHTD